MYQKKRLMYQVLAAVAAGGLCFGGTAYAAEATGEAAEKAAETASVEEYALDDIVVTAERIPTKKMDTPAVVNVVTAQDIEDNHYSDVTEAISHQDGVVIARQADGSDYVTINGEERVLILIDGRRVNSDQGGTWGRSNSSLSMLPTVKNIERIEVVRGGGSALYGSDAMGGVINIITKKEHKNRTTIDMNTGSWGTHNVEISTEGSDGRLDWFVSGALHHQGNPHYNFKGTGYTAERGDGRGNDAAINLTHKFDKASSLNFVFEHRTIGRHDWENGLPTGYGPHWARQIHNNVSVQYDFKQNQDAPGFFRIYQNYKSIDNQGEFSNRERGIDYQNGWKLDKNNTLIAGAEYRTSSSSNPGAGYQNEILSNTAVYLQDTIKLSKQWTFVPGVRMDNHSKFGTHWSPKAAINYNADDKTQVFLSWGKVFKAPTADDMYYNAWGSVGNPNLKPESGDTTSFGISHKFDKTFNINFSMYYSKMNDAITWGFDGINYTPLNVNTAKRRGLDISFNKKFSKQWSAEAGYAYSHAESDDAGNLAGVNNMQPNAFRLGVHYKQGPWKSNLTGKYITGLNRDHFLKTSPIICDFNLSYDFNEQGTVYFKVLNLFNQEYSKYPSSLSSYGDLYYPGTGRFFQIGVTYSF